MAQKKSKTEQIKNARRWQLHLQLFADTADGAMASAVLYSIIETAEANGLEPYWYLRFPLEKAPGLKSKEDLIMNMQQSHVNVGITPA